MSGDVRLRLWTTTEAPERRWFLVPDSLEPPAGTLEVRSLQGVTARLDESVLAAHEVDTARAAAHVDAGWEGAVGRVRDTWRGLVGTGGDEPPPDLGAWLGVTPGEVVTDPEKQRQARRTLIERAGKLVGAAMNDDTVDRMDQRLEKLGDALVRDVSRLRTGTEKLAERIEEKRPDIEATLGETGETLAGLGRTALHRLRAMTGSPPRSAWTDPPRDEPETREARSPSGEEAELADERPTGARPPRDGA